MPTQAEKAARFKELHEGEKAFLLPNPWDVGSAQMLAGMGAAALATTSSGHAFTLGAFDSTEAVSREVAVAHAKDIADATHVPVSGDFENGYGHTPEDVALTVKAAIEAGLAGCSIEDTTMDKSNPSYDFDIAVARVKAGVEAARSVDFPFQFCARADGFMIEAYDMDEAIRRVKAFEEAGADVLYIPFLQDIEALKNLRAAVTKPINVLAYGPMAAVSMDELSTAGANRISLGGSLHNVAMDAAYRGAKAMLEEGDFTMIGEARTLGKLHKARKVAISENK